MLSLKKPILLVFALMLNVVGLADGSKDIPLHQRFYRWPNFCFEHLSSDPDAASSWTVVVGDDYGLYHILDAERYELYLKDYEDEHELEIPSRIDENLLSEVEDYKEHIPLIENDQCSHIFCTDCGRTIIRTFGESWGSELKHNIQCYCDCTNIYCGGVNLDEPRTGTNIPPASWQFSDEKPVWSGYFQKYRSPHFAHFVETLKLCDQNPLCRCFWPEESAEMCNILDTIFIAFLDIDTPNISDSEIERIYSRHRIGRMDIEPIHNLVTTLSHSFLYSQVKEALYQLDPRVTSWFHPSDGREVSMGDYDDSKVTQFHYSFCNELLAKVRPMYLELYEKCYADHPHPLIEREMKLIAEDIN